LKKRPSEKIDGFWCGAELPHRSVASACCGLLRLQNPPQKTTLPQSRLPNLGCDPLWVDEDSRTNGKGCKEMLAESGLSARSGALTRRSAAIFSVHSEDRAADCPQPVATTESLQTSCFFAPVCKQTIPCTTFIPPIKGTHP